MRRVAAALGVVVLLLGCSDDDSGPEAEPRSQGATMTLPPEATDGQPPLPIVDQPPAGSHPVPVLGARSSEEHDALLVYLPAAIGDGPCDSTISAIVDDDAVALHAVPTPGATTDPFGCGFVSSSSTAWLAVPRLGGASKITDGATGTEIQVIDGATLVRPTDLPDGWTFAGERGLLGEWEQIYSFGPDSAAVRFAVHQGRDIDQLAEVRAWRTVRPLTIAGHAAELIAQGRDADHQLGIRWRQGEDDVLVYLSAQDPAAGPTNETLLVDLASRLAFR